MPGSPRPTPAQVARARRERLNLAAQRLLRRIARRLGWHIVRADYYSPILDIDAVPPTTFARRAPMPGIDLGLDRQLELVEQRLAPHLREWAPPLDPPGDELGFHLDNSFYGPLDAEILYAFVRELRPERILELGSGYSTLVIRRAAQANAAEGRPLEHTVLDPFPSHLLDGLTGFSRHENLPLEPSRFSSLGPGDVLFVDTTHVVKLGGEVVFLVLEVLPELAPGVIVHFHDIFRPFEYPRVLFERFNKHWQEHYLLQAFLAYNPQFRVLCANHALARLHPERMAALVPALRPEMAPSGFWIEKLGNGAQAAPSSR